jgi:hypothetical protein
MNLSNLGPFSAVQNDETMPVSSLFMRQETGFFFFQKNLFTIKPNGMQMLLNGQKGKESPKKERST